MATSGTTNFNPDLGELIEEAFERAGMEMRTGYHLRTARRSLNFLLSEWANKGVNLWTIAEATQAITVGDGTYDLPTSCVDIIEQVVRTTIGGASSDTNVKRISLSDYSAIPNKTQTGKPLQVYVDRQSAPRIVLWPVPDQSYTLVYWYLRSIQDTGAGVGPTLDVPKRFLNALCWGLAWMLAIKHPSDARNDPQMLKNSYDESFALAAEEDRDRTSFRITPAM